MILLIDIGNTNLKWTTYIDQVVGDVISVRHNGRFTEQMRLIDMDMDHPSAVYVANVAGENSKDEVAQFVREHWQIDTQFVTAEKNRFDVSNAYQEPERLGVDRWLALVAVHGMFKEPAVVIDAGTATTFDAITQSGEHLGGLILPGLDMMRESLLSKTSIPRVEAKLTKQLFASDTVEAVSAAAIQSTVALAERLYQSLEDREVGRPVIVLTGGNAENLRLQLTHQDAVICVPDLIMKGLAKIASHRANQ